ncbi:hypothetical protein V496_00049 [Pseudogymnoascus sp. VKM F-4515 (FW-2607)]|nr:hypothetical protein V496_00049 [Pseudogymnoascus sp. VKM F-4515 (FW-2607)]
MPTLDPGCGVDIPAIFYSLSWFPNANFTSLFPPQEEILEYLRQVALRHNIKPRIRLRTEWKDARWSEKTSRWHIVVQDLENGKTFMHEAKVLVSAVGGYTNPKYPIIHGIDTFKGPIVHTAKWDQKYDLKDRNVIVIGNGCSASQVIPAIIDEASSLTQFIRSPQYYIPMPNFCINRLWQALFQYTPLLLMLARWCVFWFLETALAQFYEDKSGQRARQKSVRISQNYVRKSAPERYWPLLTPQYDMGCKVGAANSDLISVGPNSVLSASGKEYTADFIILATGFEFTQWQAGSVFGRNGISLEQHWAKFGGIEAYKTIAMNEFPNLFYLLGPNSGRGHTSVLYSIECSVDLVIKVARPILEGRAASIEVRKDAEKDWCKTVQEALKQTVLTRSCFNQFSDPKTGWNFFSYPFNSVSLWLGTRFPVMSHWSYKK